MIQYDQDLGIVSLGNNCQVLVTRFVLIWNRGNMASSARCVLPVDPTSRVPGDTSGSVLRSSRRAGKRWPRLGLACKLAFFVVVLAVLAACSRHRSNERVAAAEKVAQVAIGKARASSTAPKSGSNTPFDVGAVMRQVQYAYRAQGEVHEGGDSTYGVQVATGHLTLTPYHHPDGLPVAETPEVGAAKPAAPPPRDAAPDKRLEGAPCEVETIAVIHGDMPLATQRPTTRVGKLGELELSRGAVVERLKNSERGVEQSWAFDEQPAGDGDLVVRVAVNGQQYSGTTDQGLHFVGKEHGLGFRYGNGTWVDAKGAEIPVPARWVGGAIELRVPGDVVARATYPAVLDPVVGPEFGFNQLVYGARSDSNTNPAVASDGMGTTLAVWRAGSTIWGTRIDASGTVLDSGGIVISTSGQVAPTVSHDGTNWLVVWGDNRNSATTGEDIYGARLSEAGSVLDPSGILISSALGTQTSPAVSYDGTNWLVVWGDSRNSTTSGNDIYGARVSGAGAVLDASGIAVCATAGEQTSPAVAHNGANWLVVWKGDGVHGARVDSAGAVLDPGSIVISQASEQQTALAIAAGGSNWLIVWNLPSAMTPSMVVARVGGDGEYLDGFMISSSESRMPLNPAVSYDGTNWLVVWAQDRADFVTVNSRIYGVRVTNSGQRLDPERIVISTRDTTADRTQNLSRPAVSHDGTNWVVVWQNNESRNLFGSRISGAGAVLDPDGILVSTGLADQFSPALSHNGTHWLVVWATSAGIYGARVSGSGEVLDSGGIGISSEANATSPPALSNDGTNWFVVWADPVDDIYGARVSGAGEVLDPTPIAISFGPYEHRLPAVSYDGKNWLVVWQDSRNGVIDPTANIIEQVYGTRINGAGEVLDPDGIAISRAKQYAKVPPAVAHDGANWLVAWAEGCRTGTWAPTPVWWRGICAARVSETGAILDPEGFTISSSGAYPNLHMSPDGTTWLVTWGQDSPITGWFTIFHADIYGARVDSSGSVLDPGGIAVATATGNQIAEGVSADGADWRVVWTGLGSAGNGIYSTRVSTAGAVLDSDGGLLAGGSTNYVSPKMAPGSAGRSLLVYTTGAGSTSRVKARLLLPDACIAPATTDTTCDGIDDDCNGKVDDGYIPVATICAVGACTPAGTTACSSGTVVDGCLAGSMDSDGDTVRNCDDLCPTQVGVLPHGCPITSGAGGAGGGAGTGAVAGASSALAGAAAAGAGAFAAAGAPSSDLIGTAGASGAPIAAGGTSGEPTGAAGTSAEVGTGGASIAAGGTSGEPTGAAGTSAEVGTGGASIATGGASGDPTIGTAGRGVAVDEQEPSDIHIRGGGCDCRVAGSKQDSGAGLHAFLLVALAMVWRRRQ